MKIKEKGLTGKSANHRRDMISAKKFDAFKEMAKASPRKGSEGEEKNEVFLEFLGHKILITQDEEGDGVIDEKDIPFVKGVTLKFDGCGGDVSWSEIKVSSVVVVLRFEIDPTNNFHFRTPSRRSSMARHLILNTLEERTAASLDSTNPFRKKKSNISKRP